MRPIASLPTSTHNSQMQDGCHPGEQVATRISGSEPEGKDTIAFIDFTKEKDNQTRCSISSWARRRPLLPEAAARKDSEVTS